MSSIWRKLNEDRMLVLLEDSTKGIFRQVMLTKKQYRAVSNAIERGRAPEDQEGLKPGMVVVELKINEDVEIPADVFLGCQTIETDV
jgi:AmiR/NasT family two-component response regulator